MDEDLALGVLLILLFIVAVSLSFLPLIVAFALVYNNPLFPTLVEVSKWVAILTSIVMAVLRALKFVASVFDGNVNLNYLILTVYYGFYVVLAPIYYDTVLQIYFTNQASGIDILKLVAIGLVSNKIAFDEIHAEIDELRAKKD